MKIKLLKLEFIRGGAALLVIFVHLKQYLPTLAAYNSHAVQLFVNWGAECVMMFFILSGIVVHYSFDQKPKSIFSFLKNRAVRLHPTLFIALVLSLFVEYYCFKNYPTFNTILGNFIPYSTMRGSLAPVLWNTNPAIWSLTFEVFFYFTFALFIKKNNTLNYIGINLWLYVSLISLLFYKLTSSNFINHLVIMLSFSPIWLIGFYAYKFRNKIYTDPSVALISFSLLPIVSRLHLFPDYYDPIKYGLFSLSSVPFFLLLLNGKCSDDKRTINKGYVYIFLTSIYLFSILMISIDPTYLMTSKILYTSLPLLILICTKITFVLNRIQSAASKVIIPFFAYFGRYSYSLYLIHIPIIIFVSKTLKINIYGQISIIFISIFCLTYVIERHLQPIINKKFL